MKATSTEKLERVKSFAEAGRKLFGGPGSGPHKGEGGGGEDKKTEAIANDWAKKYDMLGDALKNRSHNERVRGADNHVIKKHGKDALDKVRDYIKRNPGFV